MSEPGPEPPASPRRPGTITAAAVLLLVVSFFNLLFGLTLIGGGDAVADVVRGSETALRIWGILYLAVGAAQAYAGIKSLALDELGRKVGIGITVIVLALALSAIAGGTGPIVSLAINGFILYTLIREREAFTR